MNKKGIISILIIIFVLILLAVSSLAAYHYKNGISTKSQGSTSALTSPKNQTNKNPQKETENVGWKTYKNEEFGFQFDFPQSWQLKEVVGKDREGTMARLGIDSQEGNIAMWDYSNISSEETLDSIKKIYKEPELQEIQIGGTKATLVKDKEPITKWKAWNYSLIISHKGKLLLFGIGSKENEKEIFDKFVSSFTFID